MALAINGTEYVSAAELNVPRRLTYRWIAGRARVPEELGKWYHYSLLTHLLESKEHVYVTRPGSPWSYKLQILSYYCPGLTAGCLTLRFAPLTARG